MKPTGNGEEWETYARKNGEFFQIARKYEMWITEHFYIHFKNQMRYDQEFQTMWTLTICPKHNVSAEVQIKLQWSAIAI